MRPAPGDACGSGELARALRPRPPPPAPAPGRGRPGAISTCSAAAVVPPGLVTLVRSCAARRGRLARQLAGADHGVARASSIASSPAGPPGRPPRPAPRSGGRHRPGRCRKQRSPRASAPRRRPSARSPTAAISRSASARCAAPRRPALAHSTVTPRPTAAGVLGIARTTARSAPSTRSNSADRLAGGDREHERVGGRKRAAIGRQSRIHHLRLDREQQRAGRTTVRRCSRHRRPS